MKSTVLLAITMVVLLVGAATADTPPVLKPAGHPHYETEGVHPISGRVGESFIFSIEYQDDDNQAPLNGYPRLLLDMNGNGDFHDADDLNLTMERSTHFQPSFLIGEDYLRYYIFEKTGTYNYAFFVLNEANETDYIGPFKGPVVLPEKRPEPFEQDWKVEVGLWLMLLFICCVVFLILGMAVGQKKEERRWKRRTRAQGRDRSKGRSGV
jgi:hypothetical protein